jgi:hypothetical protein
MNQSSPRRLLREGLSGGSVPSGGSRGAGSSAISADGHGLPRKRRD